MINALSIDLEFWYSPQLVKDHISNEPKDFVDEMLDPILDSLDANHITATFFVLGELAKKYPESVEKIYDCGHEIASHSYTHKTLHELGRVEFEKELILSKNILTEITHENPLGFRAPTFSIDDSTSWVFNLLIKHKFKYDSSIFPCKTRMYGVQDAPVIIYKPSALHFTQNDPKGEIIEFPMTVFNDKLRIPISGGFYFRCLPLWLLKSMIKIVNEKRPSIIYIHPWELYREVPRLDLPYFSNLITYYGVENAMQKFENLIKSFQFAPVRDVLGI